MKIGITRTIVWLRKQTPSARAEFARELRDVTCDCEFQRDHEDLSISRDLWWELKRSLTMEEMIKVGNVLGSYNRPGLTKGFSEGFSSTIG